MLHAGSHGLPLRVSEHDIVFLAPSNPFLPASSVRLSSTAQVIIQGSLGLRQGDGACLFAVATLDGKDVGKTAVGRAYAGAAS